MTGVELQRLVAWFTKLAPDGQRRIAATIPVTTRDKIRRIWRISEQIVSQGRFVRSPVPGSSAYFDLLLHLDAACQIPTSRIQYLARTS